MQSSRHPLHESATAQRRGSLARRQCLGLYGWIATTMVSGSTQRRPLSTSKGRSMRFRTRRSLLCGRSVCTLQLAVIRIGIEGSEQTSLV